MLIVRVIGGLGNQMFQFAAGRALSLAHKTELLLDVSEFSHYQRHHGFELATVFCCPLALAKPEDLRSVLGWQSSKLAQRLLASRRFRFLRSDRFLIEPHFHYWQGLNKATPPFYMVGYWQSERYFAHVADVIRKDFTFRQPLTGQNQRLAEKISSVNAVSLHVRRGDYANDPKTIAVHGLCPIEYYRDAVQYIADRVEEPNFFIFSDDPQWVRAHLRIPFPCSYVEQNRGAESYNDMRLMSMCKHHIIANSTFSWWAAWLDDRPDKIVIAPKRWFANYEADTRDLYCHGWVLL
jgi:hypothetical protein